MRSRHTPHHRGEHRFARRQSEWDDGGRSHRHEGRHHGGRHGERGRSRLFDHGELRFVLLRLIQEKPRHGYEMIKAIEDRAGGTYSPSPGVVYPTLTMLEELGQASVIEEGGKKLYALTEAGAAALAENQRAADAAIARMDEAAASRSAEPPAPVLRAMENLRLALRLRLGRPLDEAQARAIAAALDTAATSVEQS